MDKEQDGLIRLHTRHLDDLKKIKDMAMEVKDLVLANKADEKIKGLESEIHKLSETASLPQAKQTLMPANAFYKMVSHNGIRGTEKGREIICKFQRVSSSTQAGTLTLVLSSGKGKYANTPNDIFILNGSKGKVIGIRKGVGTGKKVNIPLTMTAAKELEIVVVVKGSEALHLKSFEDSTAPELFLIVD